MDYYVLGSGKKFAWRDVLKTLEDTPGVPQAPTTVGAASGGSDQP